MLAATVKQTYWWGSLNANKPNKAWPKPFCPFSIWKTQSPYNAQIVYKLTSPCMAIGMHRGHGKADATNNSVIKKVKLIKISTSIWKYEQHTFSNEQARTQPTSYSTTTVAVDGK